MTKRSLYKITDGDKVHDIAVDCPYCTYENEYATATAHIGTQLPFLVSTYCMSCSQHFRISMELIIIAEGMRVEAELSRNSQRQRCQ